MTLSFDSLTISWILTIEKVCSLYRNFQCNRRMRLTRRFSGKIFLSHAPCQFFTKTIVIEANKRRFDTLQRQKFLLNETGISYWWFFILFHLIFHFNFRLITIFEKIYTWNVEGKFSQTNIKHVPNNLIPYQVNICYKINCFEDQLILKNFIPRCRIWQFNLLWHYHRVNEYDKKKNGK